jgi:hypothetical protein
LFLLLGWSWIYHHWLKLKVWSLTSTNLIGFTLSVLVVLIFVICAQPFVLMVLADPGIPGAKLCCSFCVSLRMWYVIHSVCVCLWFMNCVQFMFVCKCALPSVLVFSNKELWYVKCDMTSCDMWNVNWWIVTSFSLLSLTSVISLCSVYSFWHQ